MDDFVEFSRGKICVQMKLIQDQWSLVVNVRETACAVFTPAFLLSLEERVCCCLLLLFYFVFDPYEKHIDLCNLSCSSGRSAVLLGKHFNIGNFGQTFQAIFFPIPVVLISPIDLYHFIPLSVTFTLTGGYEVSAKQNLLASASQTHFS